jgi:asparagine N-glycosylation enzyme membrane subunit Stt3
VLHHCFLVRREIMEEDINKKEDNSKEQDTFEIDVSKIYSFFKKHQTGIIYGLLILLLIAGFYSRSVDIPNLQHKYLISPDDPYFFLRYAKIFAETGKLPSNDTLMYYPVGYNPSHENLFTVYLAGYLYKIAHSINPNINMYDIGAWYAPSLFVIALIAMFFLSDELFKDKKIALVATGILAFSPAILFRTSGGFLEKEPIFLPMFLTALYFIVKSLRVDFKEEKEKKLLMGALAGIFTGLAGFASGLFIFIVLFISVFILIEVILEKLSDGNLYSLSLWFVFMYITLSIVTLKYGGFFKFYKVMQYQIPIVSLTIGWVYILIDKLSFLRRINEKFPSTKGLLSIILGIVILFAAGTAVLGPKYVVDKTIQIKELIATPMTISRFGQSVSENQPPTFLGGGTSWWSVFGISFGFGRHQISFGLTFLMFFFGAIMLFWEEFKKLKYGGIATWAFFFFTLALTFEHFTRDPHYAWINVIFAPQWIYALVFLITLIALLWANKKEDLQKLNSISLLIISMYLVSIIAANGAVRLFFIMALPASLLAAYFVKWTYVWFANKKEDWKVWTPYILAFFVIVPTFVGATMAVASMNPSISMGVWYNATNWIKENTPQDAIMTHWWDYGYLIMAKANRTTVVDPGNFYVERDYDIGGHVFNAYNYSEIMWFANKYHLVNKSVYLVIPSEDILKFVQISRLGSLSEGTSGRETYMTVFGLIQSKSVVPDNLPDYKDKYPMLLVYYALTGEPQVLETFRIGNEVYNENSTFIIRYLVPASKNTTGPILAQVYNAITHRLEVMPVTCICKVHEGCYDLNITGVKTCALPVNGGIINIPYKSKDTLFVQLYLLDKNISGFEKVYDNGLPLDVNTARGAGPLIRIYKWNWSAIETEKGW